MIREPEKYQATEKIINSNPMHELKLMNRLKEEICNNMNEHRIQTSKQERKTEGRKEGRNRMEE